MKRQLFILLTVMTLVSIGLLTTSSQTQAQEDSTPTPAPPKTATPSSNVDEDDSSDEDGRVSSDEEDTVSFEPFTQSELSVLTGNVQRPNGIIWYNDMLYTSCNGDWTLYEIESTSGSTITYSSGVRNAHTLYAESSNSGNTLDLYMPDYDLNAVVRVTDGSSPVTVSEGVEGAWGIAYLDEEEFLVSGLLANTIYRVNRNGSVEALLDGLRSPTGIVVTEDNVFVGNNGSARRSIEWVDREDLLSGDDVTLNPLVSGVQNVTGLVLADDGYLYFAYALGTRGVVGRVDPIICIENDGCTNDQVDIVLYTELPAPLAGLTISPDMRLFVHTIYRPEIYWVDLDQLEEG